MFSELRAKDGGWWRKIGKNDTLDSPGFFLKTVIKYPGAEGDGNTKLRGTIRKWGLVLGFMLIFWSWSIYKKKRFGEKSKVKKNISKRFFIVGFDARLKYLIMK